MAIFFERFDKYVDAFTLFEQKFTTLQFLLNFGEYNVEFTIVSSN